MPSNDSLHTRRDLVVGEKTYAYYSLAAAEEAGLAGVARLPASMKVLLENLLRNEDGRTTGPDDLKALAAWIQNKGSVQHEISFRPARVLMQDFTGVPAVVDLAAMRDAMTRLGGDPDKINPLNPVDLVIDHSVMVDHFGTAKAFGENVEREYERNLERYRFLRWGSARLRQFPRRAARHRHLPPGQPRIPGRRRFGARQTATSRSPIPTPWSAPTATPPWSTASPCSAGASAASRPRRPCWASRCRC